MISDSGNGNFEIPPAGNHIARCWLVADLGMQLVLGQYGGMKHQMQIGFELCDERMADGQRLFSVFSKYTVSLHEKSKLRPMLESWRGRKFTTEELKAFDVEKLAGLAAMVNVAQEESGGRIYANIKAVTPLPRGMKAPAVVNPVIVFSTQNPHNYAQLPDWLKKKIVLPDRDLDGGMDPGHNEGGDDPDMGGEFAPVDDFNDDIPF